VLDTRNIVVLAGSKWPTGATTDDPYVIPAGTPMAPVTAGTGRYKPIRQAVIVTAATAAEFVLNTGAAKGEGFDVGDVVNVMQNGAKPTLMTVATVGTISTIDYTLGVITLTNALGVIVSAGCWIEVASNGAATNPAGAVYLLENVKTRDTDLGVSVDVPAVGVIRGQVEITKLGTNCYSSALSPKQFPLIDFIPVTPGV
jgi:hypothetical protein